MRCIFRILSIASENEKPDHRLTLHWDPTLVVNDKGHAKLSFYTGDTAGTYAIRVEGITYYERPVTKLCTFNVEAN